MKKKIIPIIILVLLFSLLVGCSGNLSNEFKQFKKAHIDSRGLLTDSLSASKSMEAEVVETWFMNLKKSEESAKFELSKGIYKSLKYAQESKTNEPPENLSDISEDSPSSNDAKIFYVLMTQEALAGDASGF